ncbi:MAG: hypothetical protein JWQ71_3339 [Pedosphaera sp.]|nr:hypothetical protein [Pedosphaera sp.]
MSTLTIQLPGLPAVSHILHGDTITIGRMEGNTIVIDDTSVSLLHAKITRKDGEFILKDLNSTNGTMVNGQPIKEAKLRDSDRVRFADISGQFHAEAAVTTEPAVAVPKLPTNEPAIPKPATTPVPNQPTIGQPAINQPAKNPLTLGQSAKPQSAAAQPAKGQPSLISAAAQQRPAQRHSRQSKPADRKPLYITLAPYGGAAVAMLVISLLVWKFSRPSIDMAAVEPSVAVAPKKVSSNAPAKTVPPTPPAVVAKRTPPVEPQNERLTELMKALKDQDPAERRRAANDLHSLGPEARGALPALREALKDSDPDVQMLAALTLVNNESYDKAALPVLIHVLQHENPMFRQVACLTLGVFPIDKAERDIVASALSETASKDADEDVRKAASSALKIIAPETVANGK